MSIIYQPSGKAREYSPLAANLYMGCNHGCLYCYAPNVNFKKREDYLNVYARRNVLHELEKDCKKFVNSERQVLLSFMSDPYNSLENELRITRDALKLLLKYQIPVSILTKSKTILNDLDIIKKFGQNIQIGMTLTFDNEKDSFKWESGASSPKERINTLKTLKENNIKTWASFEPVIIPDQSLSMIKNGLNSVDIYKVGKLNNYKGLDKKMNWTEFLEKAVNILRDAKKPFYIKHDLRVAAPEIKLYGNECNQDEFNISWRIL